MRPRPPEVPSGPDVRRQKSTAVGAMPPAGDIVQTVETEPERLRSAPRLVFFSWIFRRRLQRSFAAVRVALPGVPMVSDSLPLIVYCNHPSWWEGALMPVVLGRLFPGRRIFGPIDADSLRRYGFMRRLGYFGLEPGTYGGASTFLRIGRRLLQRPGTLLCITPQGAFVDARARPLQLQPGLAGLISVVPRVTVLPLAVEYPFWGERTPEALARFGEPQVMGMAVTPLLDDIRSALEDRLTTTMDRLAQDAISRDASRFSTLLAGSSVGVGGVYDLWRRLKAWRQGERYDPAHLQGRELPRDQGRAG